MASFWKALAKGLKAGSEVARAGEKVQQERSNQCRVCGRSLVSTFGGHPPSSGLCPEHETQVNRSFET